MFPTFRDDPFFNEPGLPAVGQTFPGFPSAFDSIFSHGGFGPDHHRYLEGPSVSRRGRQNGPTGAVMRHPMMFGGGSMLSPWPFGGPDPFQAMARNMERLSNDPNAHVHSSTTVMSYSSGGPGTKPKVYQASSSTMKGPNGIKETRKSVRDSESGIQKMAVGHHIGDRSHTIERLHNVHTKDKEQRQYFENLDESDGEEFDEEWRQKTSSLHPMHNSINSSRQHRAIAGPPNPHQHRVHPPQQHRVHPPQHHRTHPPQQHRTHPPHQHRTHPPDNHHSDTKPLDKPSIRPSKRTHRPPSVSFDDEPTTGNPTTSSHHRPHGHQKRKNERHYRDDGFV